MRPLSALLRIPLAGSLLLVLASCGDAPPTGPVVVASVTVEPGQALLLRGETIQLMAAVLDADGDPLPRRRVTWTSSGPDVAAVDSTGLVTALAFGEATITATAEGEGGTAEVKVDPMIITIAGTGVEGFSGDGGPATEAELRFPCALTVDASGNLYIASFFGRVRRVNPTGIIATVAGTGVFGFGGDGGPATEAQLNVPCGLAVDGSGNLYIADELNDRIRKVDPGGIITTVVGTGVEGFGGDGGPATQAQLDGPRDVAVDADGNLYIADLFNGRVRRVDPSGIITTVVGGGSVPLQEGVLATEVDRVFPEGLAVDAIGNLYIVTGGATIWRVDPGGIIGAVATGLSFARRVALDAARTLYIADLGVDRVWRVDPEGRLAALAGTGEAGFGGDGGPVSQAQLNAPADVAVDSNGNLYIADNENHRIRKVILAP